MSDRVRVEVALEPPYAIEVGLGALDRLVELVGDRPAAVLADEHVARLHARTFGLTRWPIGELARGEASKTFAELERALDFLASRRLDRRSVVIAFGGGALCDVAGLAASLYMRGVEIVLCPTTLLAMVDASIGGKTAIDLRAGKNLVGTFHQPIAVVADTRALATLEPVELRSGLGEVVKSALLDGESSLAALERDAEALTRREPAAIQGAIERSVRLKARIVAGDPRELGPRKALNLGHTFAHAIERVAGFGVVPHGVAVAVGIVLALEAARRTDRLRPAELVERVRSLLRRLGLPTSLAELAAVGTRIRADALCDAMTLDKKGLRGEARFVLPRALGEIELDVALDPSDLQTILDR